MADAKISALPAVVTPAAADEFAVNQGGTSKKQTRAQIHALEATEHLVLPQVNEAATPTLSFGDGDSGFHEPIDDNLKVSLVGIDRFFWELDAYNAAAGTGPAMKNVAAGAAVAGLVPRRSDGDTGIGSAGGDILTLVAGGVEIAQAKEVVGANQFIVAPGVIQNNAAAPSLAFGDGDTGFYEGSDDNLFVAFTGIEQWKWTALEFKGSGATGVPSMINEVSSATNPVWSFQADPDTGVGRAAADQLSLIAGGVEVAALTEAAGVVQFVVPIQDNAANPSIAFGVLKREGFYQNFAGFISVAITGVRRFAFGSTSFGGVTAGSGALFNETSSPTNPTLVPDAGANNAGLGGNTGQPALIAGGITCLSVSESGGARQIGFYETSPISRQTGVAVTTSAVHAALVNLGLITA